MRVTLSPQLSSANSRQRDQRQDSWNSNIICDAGDWDIYLGPEVLFKMRWDLDLERSVPEPLPAGVAHAQSYHAEGAERVVFHCTEVAKPETPRSENRVNIFTRVGPWMFSKETKHEENIKVSPLRSPRRALLRIRSDLEI